MKHSSYTYQKLFRAIYGYTQTVCKSSGKTYRYHRQGVLSKVPYIRPGKNCVIIPQGVLNQLTDFFKTGKNPAHYWHVKGDWKAVYYMDEKGLKDGDIVKALEELLARTYVLITSSQHERLVEEIQNLLQTDKGDETYKKLVLKEASQMVSHPWFKETYKNSAKLTQFYTNYKALVAKLS